MKKLVIIGIFLLGVTVLPVIAQQTEESTAVEAANTSNVSWKYLSAALAVGLACIGGAIAVGQIGTAAMGALSENAEVAGKAIPFVGLAEGICLWGFLVALLILVLN
ncbi:MAG: ATP synthase subunit C [Spirochaetaceae bacterium]|jgi:V/A-type H+-transporting ATPase subunit K|nr:ATP synthase subunit C [Spirochaetaceae bacterium]